MEPSASEDTFKSEFHLFLGLHKVSINRLLDSDLKIRKRGLNEINKLVNSIENQDENEKAKLKEYWRNHLLKPLVLVYDDKVGKHRELSIEITTGLINMFGVDVEAQVIIPGILARMNKMPYPEEYEEIRIEFLELLELILDKDSSQFLPFLSETSIMLSKIILDSNPEMKNKAAMFVKHYCDKLSER